MTNWNRRAVIAQNKKHIYITIAKYDDRYVRYLNGKCPISSKNMMKMCQFGPFRIENPEEVRLAAGILLALHM